MNRRRLLRVCAGGACALPVPLLAACGGNVSATTTAISAATAAVGRPTAVRQARPNVDIAGIPQRAPDRSVGANTDGWILDRIETGQGGGFATFTVRFVPPKDETSIPQTDAWFDEATEAYILEFHGVRGENPTYTLRPDEVQMLAIRPLTGYYAPSMRSVADDSIYLLVVTAMGVRRASWSLAAGTAPGIVRLSVAQP